MLSLITKINNNTNMHVSYTLLIKMNLILILKINNKPMTKVEIDSLSTKLHHKTCFIRTVGCKAKKALNSQELKIDLKRDKLEKFMDSSSKQTTLNLSRYQKIKQIKMTPNLEFLLHLTKK